MVSKEYIESILNKYKAMAAFCIKRKKYELAIEMISNTAKILYESNIKYRDNELEIMLENISDNIITMKLNSEKTIDNVLLFFDGFGFNNRGLAQIYLKALVKFKKIIYVTYSDRKNEIPDILKILKNNNSEVFFLDRKKLNYYNQILFLNEIVCKYRPFYFFLYTTPYDVVSTTVLYSYENVLKRYQINLTDHAFWIGCNCIDCCIEFRNYGAYISNEYRRISKSKIFKLPFYPLINAEKEFEGFPFEVSKNEKVVFSGGALYKTISADNKYYKIVDKLLYENDNVLFWYAGSGNDIYLRKIIEKYPSRVHFTSERNDLYQILKRSCFYLSTYPICGGLMFQYAAKAGCVPITLKYDDISNEFLINQNLLDIEFVNEELLLSECKRLLEDDSYREYKKEKMKDTVIKEEIFDKNLKNILDNNNSEFEIEYNHVKTKRLKEEYLKRLRKKDIYMLLASIHNLRATFIVTPIKGILGVFYKLLKK